VFKLGIRNGIGIILGSEGQGHRVTECKNILKTIEWPAWDFALRVPSLKLVLLWSYAHCLCWQVDGRFFNFLCRWEWTCLQAHNGQSKLLDGILIVWCTEIQFCGQSTIRHNSVRKKLLLRMWALFGRTIWTLLSPSVQIWSKTNKKVSKTTKTEKMHSPKSMKTVQCVGHLWWEGFLQ